MAIIVKNNISAGPYDSTYVVESVGDFPRGNNALDAAFVADMIASLITDGVTADSFAVSCDSGLSIKVSAGICWIRGRMGKSKSEHKFELAAGHDYTVFLRQEIYPGRTSLAINDDSDGVFQKSNTDNCQDLVLAKISIPEGTLSVADYMITDCRENTSLCGFVSSRLS